MYENIVNVVNESVPTAIEHLSSTVGVALSNMPLGDKILSGGLVSLGLLIILGRKKAIQLVQ